MSLEFGTGISESKGVKEVKNSISVDHKKVTKKNVGKEKYEGPKERVV